MAHMRAVDDVKSTRELVVALNHTRNELRGIIAVLDDGSIPPSEKEYLIRMVASGLLACSSPYRDESS